MVLLSSSLDSPFFLNYWLLSVYVSDIFYPLQLFGLFSDKRPVTNPSRINRPSDMSNIAYLENLNIKHCLKKFQVSFASPEGQARVLIIEILVQSCGPNEIILTEGLLEDGLLIPLYFPLDPFQYVVLCRLDPKLGIIQTHGNLYRVVQE